MLSPFYIDQVTTSLAFLARLFLCSWQNVESCKSVKLKLKLIYFLLSATSSMPLALYNRTHTLVWIQWTHNIHIQWNTAHIQAFIHGSHFGADTMFFMSGTHTLTLLDVVSGLCLPDSSFNHNRSTTTAMIQYIPLNCLEPHLATPSTAWSLI